MSDLNEAIKAAQLAISCDNGEENQQRLTALQDLVRAIQAARILTGYEAFEAWQHALEMIAGAEMDEGNEIEALDEASDIEKAYADCPEDFTDAQKSFAQQIILRAFEKAIGRA